MGPVVGECHARAYNGTRARMRRRTEAAVCARVTSRQRLYARTSCPTARGWWWGKRKPRGGRGVGSGLCDVRNNMRAFYRKYGAAQARVGIGKIPPSRPWAACSRRPEMPVSAAGAARYEPERKKRLWGAAAGNQKRYPSMLPIVQCQEPNAHVTSCSTTPIALWQEAYVRWAWCLLVRTKGRHG